MADDMKKRILKLQEFIDGASYVEVTDISIDSYEIKLQTFVSMSLEGIDDAQKAIVLRYVGNHNIQFVKLNTEVLKQTIAKLEGK